MRTSLASLVVLVTACAPAATTSPPIAPPPPPPSQPRPATALQAAFAGQPFVARSALMLKRNYHGRGFDSKVEGDFEVVSSGIYVFDRTVSCRDFKRRSAGQYEIPLVEERTIQLQVLGMWPPPAGTVLRTPDKYDDLRIAQVDVSFDTGPSGSLGAGTVTIVEATPTSALLAIDIGPLIHGEHFARGILRVAVCP